jgi:hypothetical protein
MVPLHLRSDVGTVSSRTTVSCPAIQLQRAGTWRCPRQRRSTSSRQRSHVVWAADGSSAYNPCTSSHVRVQLRFAKVRKMHANSAYVLELHGRADSCVPRRRQSCVLGWRRGGRESRRWRPACCRASWTPRRCPTGVAARHRVYPHCHPQRSCLPRRRLTLPPSTQPWSHEASAPKACR